MDLTELDKKSDIELKAIAYDLLAIMQRNQELLRLIAQKLEERARSKAN